MNDRGVHVTAVEYLRLIRARWAIIVAAALCGLAGAGVVYLVSPAQYTASTSLYVSAQIGDDPQQAYQGAQLSEQRVKSYTELVTGDRVIDETLRRLRLGDSREKLRGEVSAATASESVIIDVSVVDSSPRRAADIANTVAQVTAEVVADLEQPLQPGASAPVVVRVVQPADTPGAPTSPGPLNVLAIGLLVGLVVGVVVAVIRHNLDTDVKDGDRLAEVTELPLLGSTVHDPRIASGSPLVVRDDPHGTAAEAFRQIRTNLQFLDVDQVRKVILFTSASATEGKSTTVANLAIAVGSTGTRLLVIEADLRRPRLSSLLGLDNAVGLTQVLSGKIHLPQAVQSWGGGAFDVLASGPVPPNPSELLASKQMRALIDEARLAYDLVLIDSPPLLPVTDSAALAPATDGVVLVARYRHVTFPQVKEAVKAVEAVSAPVLGTVLGAVPLGRRGGYAGHGAYPSRPPEQPPAHPGAGGPERLRPAGRSTDDRGEPWATQRIQQRANAMSAWRR